MRDHNVKNIDLNKIVLKRKQELSHSLQAAISNQTPPTAQFLAPPQFPPIKKVEEFFKIESKHYPDDGTSQQSTDDPPSIFKTLHPRATPTPLPVPNLTPNNLSSKNNLQVRSFSEARNPNLEKYNNVEKYKYQAKLFNKIKSLVNQQSPKMTINNINKSQLKHKLKDSHCYVDEEKLNLYQESRKIQSKREVPVGGQVGGQGQGQVRVSKKRFSLCGDLGVGGSVGVNGMSMRIWGNKISEIGREE